MMTTENAPQEKKYMDDFGSIALALGLLAFLMAPVYAFSMLSIGFGVLFGIIGIGVSLITRRKVSGRSLGGIIICTCVLVGQIFIPTFIAKCTEMSPGTMTKLRGLRQSAALYELDYGHCPNNLDELLKVGLDPKFLTSPFSGQQYVYMNLPQDAPDELIWAYDPSPDRQTIYVVLQGGMVRDYEPSELNKLLKQTRDFIAEHSNAQ